MVSYQWFLGMIVVFTAVRLVLISEFRPPAHAHPTLPDAIPIWFNFPSLDGPATPGDRLTGLEPQGPDLETAREAQSRISLRCPPWCRLLRREAG